MIADFFSSKFRDESSTSYSSHLDRDTFFISISFLESNSVRREEEFSFRLFFHHQSLLGGMGGGLCAVFDLNFLFLV